MQLLVLHERKQYQVKKFFCNFMKCLEDTALNKVQVISNRKVFNFGNGRKVYLKYKTIIPAKIGKAECFVQTKIVNKKNVLVK